MKVGNKNQNLKLSFPYKIWNSGILEFKPLSFKSAIIFLFISYIQIIFLQFKQTYFIFSNRNMTLDSALKGLTDFFIGQDITTMYDLDILNYLILGFTSIYLISNAIILISILLSIKKFLKIHEIVCKMWGNIVYAHFFIFFFPIQNILFNLLFTSLDAQSSTGTWIDYIVIAISAVGTIINVGIVVSVYIITTTIKTGDPFSRLTNRAIYTNAIQKLVMSLLIHLESLASDKTLITWVIVVLNLLILIVDKIVEFKAPPYSSRTLCRLSWSFSTVSFLICIWNMTILFSQGIDSTVSTGYLAAVILLLSPLIIKSLQITLDSIVFGGYLARETYSEKHRFKEVEFLRDLAGFLKKPIIDPETQFLAQETLIKLGVKSISHIINSIDTPSELGEELYNIQISKKLPTLISITIAEILIKECGFLAKAYFICTKLLTYPVLSFTELLTIYSLIGALQKSLLSNQAENLELLSFMESMNSHDHLGKLVESQLHAREKFYLLLEGDDPDLEVISQASHKIQEIEIKIQKLWSSLDRKKIEEYPPLLKMFAFFKIFVELQSETGKDLIKQYNKLIIKKTTGDPNKSKSIYSTNTVFVVVGGDSTNLGKIMSCTLNIKRIFGYESKDVLGKNIGILMPKMVAANHDTMMRSRLDNAENMMKIKTNDTLGLHVNGHLIPISYKSTIYPILDEGLSFWGMIKYSPTPLEQLVVNENGVVEGMSAYLKESLLIELNEKTLLSSLCRLPKKRLSRRESSLSNQMAQASPVKLGLSAFNPVKTPASTEKFANNRKEFERTIAELLEDNTEFFLAFFKRIIKPGKVHKYKCDISSKIFGGKKMFFFSMKKFALKAEREKESSDSEDFNNINEHSDIDLTNNSPGIDISKGPRLTSQKSDTVQNSFFRNISKISQGISSELKGSLPYGSHNAENSEDDDDENENDEDDPKISDNSEKQMDDRASMLSVNSSKYEKELESSLLHIVKSLKYYRFREAHVPFIFLIFFLISFISLIFVMYNNATKSTVEVENRIHALDMISLRGQDISIIITNLFPLWLYDKVFRRPFDNASLFYVAAGVPFYKDLIAKNTELKKFVSYLSEEEKSFFFAEDIRMYTDDFNLIPNTTKYQMVDTFTIVNSIYSNLMYFTNNFRQNGSDARNYAFNFLFGNLLNDLWIKNLEGPEKLTRSMQEAIDHINNVSDISYGFALSTLSMLGFSLIFVIIKSYFDTKSFLRIIINTGPSAEITNALNNLRFFKGFLTKKLNGSDRDQRELAKLKKSKQEKAKYKHGKSTSLFSKILKRLLITVSLLIVPYILTWRAHSVYLTAAAKIMPIIHDINALNKIMSTGAPVNGFLGLIYSRPQTKVLNTNILKIIDQAIEDSRDSVSITNGFLPETEEFLNKDFCPYYVVNARFPNCTTMFRQLGMRGIVSTVLAASDYRRQYKNMITTTPITAATIAYFVFQADFIESGFLYGFGIGPAISAYQRKMVDQLIDDLSLASKNTVVLFAPGIVFGILISIAIGYLIYHVMWKERKTESGTLSILPLDLVMNNRHLREYLLNQSRSFYKMIKKFDSMKRKENNLMSKFKK